MLQKYIDFSLMYFMFLSPSEFLFLYLPIKTLSKLSRLSIKFIITDIIVFRLHLRTLGLRHFENKTTPDRKALQSLRGPTAVTSDV